MGPNPLKSFKILHFYLLWRAYWSEWKFASGGQWPRTCIRCNELLEARTLLPLPVGRVQQFASVTSRDGKVNRFKNHGGLCVCSFEGALLIWSKVQGRFAVQKLPKARMVGIGAQDLVAHISAMTTLTRWIMRCWSSFLDYPKMASAHFGYTKYKVSDSNNKL